MELDDIFAAASPEGFSVRDTTARLARHGERDLRDAALGRFNYLRFRLFAGRGLRYAFELSGGWAGVAGWQTGSSSAHPGPPDPLHMVVRNTRMAVLGVPGAYPGLCSQAMGRCSGSRAGTGSPTTPIPSH